ncbi:hypothetical protein [Bdellovibrio reynosensis]|uniref:Secreted protein n=1 Tax=Bdellovibrio reynosensis TaxID=2835041 RepID=A0ABY4C4Z9_9BACT|nr:hypothetical protein [Bdellovibrio reynosensis]UOF00035.1 hypothetical protein MNR06_10010 [Bdellovibrio reynosensis]
MNFKNVKRSAMVFALSASFIMPAAPNMVWAMGAETSFPLDLFPEDKETSTSTNDTSDTGLFPTTPTNGSGGRGNNNNNSGKKTTSANASSNGTRMGVAKVPDAYSCPLFDNRPHTELLAAIDSLSKEVKASPECAGVPSAKTLEDNGNQIKESIATLQKLMQSQDASEVNVTQIDQSMSAALAAVGNLGDIVNNNNFLNSKCGRQTMSTGKVLLALNDVINGMAPYALFAVSMSAALAPALPFVIGGAIATSGISAISKMIDQNTLDMTNPEHRKAVLQNTCQFTKVAKKVRFMQLAQSGKIDKITQELERNVELYNSRFGNPSRELSGLLRYRELKSKTNEEIQKRIASDRSDLAAVEEQVSSNNDDIMVCTLGNELVNWAADGKSFPASAFLNLDAVTSQGDRSQRLQATTMKTLHATSIRRIAELAPKAYEDESNLRACAQSTRTWITGVRQAISATGSLLAKNRTDLEAELSGNAEYRQWKLQYNLIETEKLTIKRVEKAMQELAKDNSIVDRSELAQRMVLLKSGLFGSRSAWGFGNPPVLAWINHTKTMHDQAVAAFSTGVRAVRNGSYSLTDAGRGKHVKYTISGMPYTDPKVQVEANQIMQTLSNINLTNLPLGSREQEIVCQQLESAWLDWSAAIDHIGAIQFFCDMIDPVLDVKMDSSVMNACRGNTQLNGSTLVKSTVQNAKDTLVRKGFQADANLISQKLKALQCPMPAVSVMNQ